MLSRALLRRFSASVYSWGENVNVLGYETKDFSKMFTPQQIGQNLPEAPRKVVSGFCDALALTQNGSVFHIGSGAFNIQNDEFQKLDQSLIGGPIADMDCDGSSLLFLAQDGRLTQLRFKEKAPSTVDLHMRAKHIATGSDASLAIAEDENVGHTHVFAWGSSAPNQGALFLTDNIKQFDHPVELKQISKLISNKKAHVKKLKLVGNSAVILLDNGELITWGDNTTGNLAVPRSELSFIHNNVRLPAEPLKLNNLDIKVADFDLSSNVLVLLTTDGRVFLSGFDNILKLKQVPFFEGQKVTAVGASFNHYYLQAEDGLWYANKPFEGQELIKYFGAVDLVQLEPRFFGNGPIHSISGKYTNALAL